MSHWAQHNYKSERERERERDGMRLVVKVEEGTRKSPVDLPEGTLACQHFDLGPDFRLLTSRSVDNKFMLF